MIPLELIGIPNRDDHQGCKVLIISRDLNVLLKLGVRTHFQLQVLQEEEAWKLFEKKAGNLKTPELQSVAVEVARRCAGLPLLIVLVASSLREKEMFEWIDALQQLRWCDDKGVAAQVYSALEVSYKFLGDESKSVLVLCSQLFREIYVRDLLKYAMGLGLCHKCFTIKDARVRLLQVINDLKRKCFLVDGVSQRYVTVHDVVRSFAKVIASRQHHVFTYDSDTEEWPEKDTIGECSAISLPRMKIAPLPEVLECPKLESFIFYSYDPFLKIPENFFSGTKNLKLVDLSHVDLSTLPLSLCFLENLQTLCLEGCVLGDITTIGELKKLQVLSLVSSDIVQLPEEIRNLTRLRLLDLSGCERLEFIPQGILNCLTKLEDLSMLRSFVNWKEEDYAGNINNASVSELKLLSNLINLEIDIKDAKIIPVDLFHWKLEIFKICIGGDWDWYGNIGTSRILKLKFSACTELEKVKILLKGADDLYLDDLRDAENVLPTLNEQGYPKLMHLLVQNCSEMQYIIDSKTPVDSATFPNLESLSLLNLNKLEEICSAPITRSSFNKLKTLKVGNCNAMENMFSFSMFACLVQLQYIKVGQCKILTEIVSFRPDDEDNDLKDEMIELTQLRTLTLEDLPQFVGFFSSNVERTNREAGETSLLDDARKKIQFRNLMELELSSVNVENICHIHDLEFCPFGKLATLIVRGCVNLAFILTSSMVRGLGQLKKFEICDCKSGEEVINTEGETNDEIIFPNLIVLKLKGLPKAVKFCRCNLVRCPSLDLLLIEHCPSLQNFVSSCPGTSCEAGQQESTLFNEKVEFPNLEQLKLVGVNGLKVIWDDELHQESFCKLTFLAVENSKEVMRIFPLSHQLTKFQNLDSLHIHGCDAVQEAFDIRAHINMKERGSGTSFRLKKLWLWNLQNLKNIWNKDLEGMLNFHKLSDVDIRQCPFLRSVFPASIARGLVDIKALRIADSGIEEVIAGNEEGLEGGHVYEFSRLEHLQLRRLPELQRFYPGAYTSEWPNLKELNVTECKKFQHSNLSLLKNISNIEELTLNGKEVAMIRGGQVAVDLFQKLKVLELNFFYESSEIFPSDLLHIFHNLETLEVARSKIKELFPPEVRHQNLPPKLKSLGLYTLYNLSTIWNQVLQTIEILVVYKCDRLTNLAPSPASFHNLKSLEIIKCKGLVSLVTVSTAKSLVRLEKLRLSECNNVEDIVSCKGDETMDVIDFTKLKSLELECLPNLTSFCAANHKFKFPSLTEANLKQCPRMEFFSRGVSTTPLLEFVQLAKEESRGEWLGNLNLTISFLHNKMVGFRRMQHLKVSEFPNLKDRWFSELPVEFLCDLRSLVVDERAFSSYAIPSNLLAYTNNLEELDVMNCEISEVFDLRGFSVAREHARLLPNLNRYHLNNLPRLRHVWSETPRGILNFKHLKLLKVHNCSNLRVIFTPSMTGELVQLQEMEIKSCLLVEKIISEAGEETETNQIISFPLLNSLVLESMPKLTSFYTGSNYVQCPSLEKITAMHCPMVEVFTCSAAEEVEPIFFGKVKGPELKELRVDWSNNIEKVFDKLLVAPTLELCFSLKVLELKHFPSKYSVLSCNSLERFPDLQELVISDALFEEIFSQVTDKNEEESSARFIPLKRLALSQLPRLSHLIRNNTESGSFIQQVDSLDLSECTKLTILVPSSVSFQNLTTLKVSKCHELLELITSSTARSLTRLMRLEITECKKVERIITNETDGAEAEIGFSQLKHLELVRLPKLKRFSSGSETCSFPCLEEEIVRECPNMDIVVEGEMFTPNLTSIQTTEDENEWRWEGSLNDTIHKLFKKSVAEKAEEH